MDRESAIRKLLIDGLSPSYLEIMNESSQHRTAPGAETHFRVVCVSDAFEGLSRVKRHQAVNNVLSEHFREGLHALSLYTYTSSEWVEKGMAPDSPACSHKK